MKNQFSNDELNIIKAALNKQHDHLKEVIDTIDYSMPVEPLTSITWNADGIKETIKEENGTINYIRVKQEEIENIVEKINDLIVYGTVVTEPKLDPRKVFLDSFGEEISLDDFKIIHPNKD